MNKKWEKKMNNSKKAKELFLQYQEKETQIKNMLKTYGKKKEEGASKEELVTLKETIKKEQVKLLEDFNAYKDFQEISKREKYGKVDTKPETKLKPQKIDELKVIAIRKPKPRAKETIKLMSMKKLEDDIKIIPLSKSELMERKAARTRKVATKRNLEAEIISITGEKKKETGRKQKSSTTRKIKGVKKYLNRKYHIVKTRGKHSIKRKLKSFKQIFRKKIRAFQKVWNPSKERNSSKRRIEPPKQQRKFKMINMVDNIDGHIEANANEKIRKMPENLNKEDKQLNVIGW